MHQNYIRAGIGANAYTDDLDDLGYDPSVDFDVAYGRYLAKYLVVEAGFQFFSGDQDFAGRTATAGFYTRDDQLSVSAILVTLKAEIPVGPVTLFAGAGVGGYYVVLDTEIDTSYLGSFDADDDDAVFGAHVVVGGYYNINDRIFVGGQGMYRWTEDAEFNKIVATVPIRLKGNLDGYAVTVSAGFRF